MVDPILDLLLHKAVITKEGYRNVMSKSTPQAKMRQIYEHMHTKKAKATFFQGLEAHEEHLLDEL